MEQGACPGLTTTARRWSASTTCTTLTRGALTAGPDSTSPMFHVKRPGPRRARLCLSSDSSQIACLKLGSFTGARALATRRSGKHAASPRLCGHHPSPQNARGVKHRFANGPRRFCLAGIIDARRLRSRRTRRLLQLAVSIRRAADERALCVIEVRAVCRTQRPEIQDRAYASGCATCGMEVAREP
jgi:hypothetical protein